MRLQVFKFSSKRKDATSLEDLENLEEMNDKNRGDNEIRSCSLDWFLLKTCLSSKLCLRDQLVLSFGFVSIISLLVVFLTAILTIFQAGKEVRNISRHKFENWLETKLELKSRFLAETMEQKIRNWESLIAIVQEATRDRFRGYPDFPGYDGDSTVPFVDHLTKKNTYPLKRYTKIPIDWKLPEYPSQALENELTQGGRNNWIRGRSSAMTCSIKFQGACNPNETNKTAPTYLQGCIDDNNDIDIGGKISPTNTFHLIHDRASDYCEAIFRPLWEYHEDVLSINTLFFNDGAGAMIDFPAVEADGNDTYISDGCDWMWQRNPLDVTKNIGREDEIARCHAQGQLVSMREFNPNEKKSFSLQALDPDSYLVFGPNKHSWQGHQIELIMSGAVYDIMTKSLIGVVQILLDTKKLSQMMQDLRISESSEVLLVRFDNYGTVVASTKTLISRQILNVSQLGIGIDDEAYLSLKQAFDRVLEKEEYDPSEFHRIIFLESSQVSLSLVPLPPTHYDPKYRPYFMVLSTTADTSILESQISLHGKINARVNSLVLGTVIVGLVCLVVVISIVFVVSLFLTKPLEWIKRIGNQLMHNFGDFDLGDILKEDISRWGRFSPRTEIKDFVVEFQSLVMRFSGEGVAKLWKQSILEVKNPFNCHHFDFLYLDRMRAEFKYQYSPLPSTSIETSWSANSSPSYIHLGGNVKGKLNFEAEDGGNVLDTLRNRDEKYRTIRSPLFWWIVGSITLPLLLGMISICVIVSKELYSFFPEVGEEIEKKFVKLEKISLKEFSSLRAAYASEIMFSPCRNLFLLTRVTDWILSGAVNISTPSTKVSMAAEECKKFPEGRCDYFNNPKRAVCSCEWHDLRNTTCFHYPRGVRDLQLVFVEGLMDDVWPDGERNLTSFPLIANSPETTSFWPNMSSILRFKKRNSHLSHTSTYERMQIIAATSVIQIPLYNYCSGSTKFNRQLSSYIAFEADGLFGGYSGCEHAYPDLSKFKSSKENNAAKINEKLCPLGKFGYDPRCRGWYAAGKDAGLSGGNPLHVTVPYIFALNNIIGQSVTQSLIDPMSGEHIGQALIDFTSDRIFASLSDTMTPLVDGFHVLIALKPDDKGNDVVIAPGFNFRELEQIEKASIEYFVLPYGSPPDKPGVSGFENILTEMRSGLFGAKDFNRFDRNGEIESINIAYAPVTVTSLRPLNSTDLSRGTEKYRSQIFSLALAEKVKGLQDSVKGVGFALEKTSQVCLLVLCILIAAGVLSVILLSSRVTFSIITPIAYLLALTRSINNLDDDWAHFGVFRGPIEVYHVHHMLRQLCLLVGFANRAFYSGDISKAIENFTEALALFTKLGNTKAMGITSNNLGNTMLTIYRTMVKTGSPTICGLTKSDVLEKGRSYFDNAIKFGEQALAEEHEKQGWSTNYLIFLQQLSNRYFNRAMFLLTTKSEHDHPDEAEQKGLSDLGIAKDMDREVVDDGERYGFKGDSDLHFDLLMGRIMGILQLLQLGYDDFWGIEELFSEALDAINHSISEPQEESLFRAISPPGQMQRLDGALISYFLSEKFKNKLLAAQIAIRMLREDQYVIRDAAILALNALIEFSTELTPKDLDGGDQSNLRSELFQYRRRISEASFIAKYNGKNGFLRERFKQCNQGDFFMEIF